jgi:hypothetical protein
VHDLNRRGRGSGIVGVSLEGEDVSARSDRSAQEPGPVRPVGADMHRDVARLQEVAQEGSLRVLRTSVQQPVNAKTMQRGQEAFRLVIQAPSLYGGDHLGGGTSVEEWPPSREGRVSPCCRGRGVTLPFLRLLTTSTVRFARALRSSNSPRPLPLMLLAANSD